MAWLDTVPLLLIGVGVAGLMVLAEEVGFRCRRRAHPRAAGRGGQNDDRVGALVAAALSLLGLLFAFTFAMAQDRYDQRRRLVGAEAAAVSTGYLRYQAFDEPERGRLSGLMVEYVELRSRGFNPQVERARLEALVARTAALQARIWAAVLRGLEHQPELTEPVMETTNEMFEVAAMRRTMVDARLPASIQFGLLAFALLTAFFTGYGLMLDRSHRLPTAVLFLLFAFVYLLVLDLDRSYSGSVRVSQAAMIRAAENIAAMEAAKLVGAGPARAPRAAP